MNSNKLVLLLLMSLVSLQTIHAENDATTSEQEAEECSSVDVEKNDFDDLDAVGQEFDEFELQKPQEYKEPSRVQVWATAIGLALLIKYFEVRDHLSDWRETLGSWWDEFLLFFHLKNEEKNKIDESHKA